LDKAVCEMEVEIKNVQGFHMRPAMMFVDVSNKYKSKITVTNGKISADGKSIMQMCMLAAPCGNKFKIKAEGNDAENAAEALKDLVESRHFDEPLP
jgi:phosphocarrier protein HPr